MIGTTLSRKLHHSTNTVYFSFSPQRSGQHLVISWLCQGFDKILHINHARVFLTLQGLTLTPLAGRISYYDGTQVIDSGKRNPRSLSKISRTEMPTNREFWSIEDIAPQHRFYKDFGGSDPARVFIILRDPANWLASTFQMGKWKENDFRRKIAIYLETLRAYAARKTDPRWYFIRFNDFIGNTKYREALSSDLDGHTFERAEPALRNTPDFGGGSSFAGLKGQAGAGVTERWHAYQDDPLFRDLLSGTELRSLAEDFFGHDHLAFLDKPAPLAPNHPAPQA